MVLVAFAGRAGCGKDTCADVLVERAGFSKLAFATSLKRCCQYIFELADEQLWGATKDVVDPRYSQTPRALMQMLGTDFVRERVAPDFWVSRLLRDAERAPRAVVADVRFQNEVDAIRHKGGRVYLVRRPGSRVVCERAAEHSSEQAADLQGFAGVIENDGTLAELRAKVVVSVMA